MPRIVAHVRDRLKRDPSCLREKRPPGCRPGLDAQPGGWLIFNGGGPLGGRRYACSAHRTDLTADLRAHYGAMCRLVHDAGPYPALWPDGFSSLDERELADLLAGARTCS